MVRRDSDSVAANVILGQLSDHLDGLAAHVFELERMLGDGLKPTKFSDFSTITKLQSLDYLRQSLEDVALLTCFLSESVTESPMNEIQTTSLSEKLRLKSTQMLLKGKVAPAFGQGDAHDGDPDWF